MSGTSTKAAPLAELYPSDASYLAERIGELHSHAAHHEGELCSKLNRARIGGMIEVLNRIHMEVECDWDNCTRNVRVLSECEFLMNRMREGK